MLDELERLSIISKICSELENHLNFGDKVLAEFIFSLFQQCNGNLCDFEKLLADNGAEFPHQFVSSLHAIISQMVQAAMEDSSSSDSDDGGAAAARVSPASKSRFSALSLPNDPNAFKKILKDQQEASLLKSQSMGGGEKDRITNTSVNRHGRNTHARDTHGRDMNRRDTHGRDMNRRDTHGRDMNRRDTHGRDMDRRDYIRHDDRRGSHDSRDHRHDGDRRRRRSRSPHINEADMDDDPVLGKIYDGNVANLTHFGAFVLLHGVHGKREGLVHISMIVRDRRLAHPDEVLERHQRVKVKVLDVQGRRCAVLVI
jgi:ATP-dependent RNA helicase DHX8/PRP22